MSSIGDNIKSARRNCGLSQEQLAHSIGVTKAAISRYESGAREPRNDQLKAIAKALNVTAAYLQGYEPTTDQLIISSENLRAIVDCISANYSEITYHDRFALIELIETFSKLNDNAQFTALARLNDLSCYRWNEKAENIEPSKWSVQERTADSNNSFTHHESGCIRITNKSENKKVPQE